MIKNLLNPKEHQNIISGSKVTAILLRGWILPICGFSAGEGLRLQPTQQAFYYLLRIIKRKYCTQICDLILSKWCFANYESLLCSLDLCQQSAWSQ